MKLSESEVRNLAAQGEGLTIAIQRELPLNDETQRSLCALANTRGGHLLVGVSEEIEFLPQPKQIQGELRRIGANFISPPIDVQTAIASYGDRLVVIARVESSGRKPHSVLWAGEKPEPYVRVGDSNQVATGPTLGALGIGHRPAKPSDPLERRLLEWIAEREKKARGQSADITYEMICKALNLGAQRVKRALVNLERDGYVVAHGDGKARLYAMT